MKFDFLQVKDSKPRNAFEQRCYKQLKNIMTDEDTYTLIKIPDYDDIYKTVAESDKVRFEWLAEHENGVYLDLDLFLKERFIPPQNGKPCLPINQFWVSQGQKILDIYLIYTNGNTDWIKRNLNQKNKEEYLKQNRHRIKNKFYSYPSELMRKLTGYNVIPKNVYQHQNKTMKKLIEEENMAEQKTNISEIVNIIQRNTTSINQNVFTLESVVTELAVRNKQLETKIKELETKKKTLNKKKQNGKLRK